jgi:hypothetical protein
VAATQFPDDAESPESGRHRFEDNRADDLRGVRGLQDAGVRNKERYADKKRASKDDEQQPVPESWWPIQV